MFAGHFHPFVTSVAGILVECGGMAGGAGDFALFAVVEGEGVVGEAGGSPGGGGVAGGAVKTEESGV